MNQKILDLENAIKAKLKAIADRNADGKLSKDDVSFAVSHAVQTAMDEVPKYPKVALAITAVVSAGVTSMLWAIFCH